MSAKINKPVKLIVGDIENQLKVGSSVAIYCEDGRIIITSPVEKVKSHMGNNVEIETKNTIYRLILMDKNKQ